MKIKFNSVIFTIILFSGINFAIPASADPQLTVQSERAAHPRLVKAIDSMQEAYKELQEAPDDFGGNKGQAMTDTKQAIHSLKKALYYRLNMDDAAIDRAQ